MRSSVRQRCSRSLDGTKRPLSTVRAADGDEEIGIGAHERVVVQLAKLSERMKAKFVRVGLDAAQAIKVESDWVGREADGH